MSSRIPDPTPGDTLTTADKTRCPKEPVSTNLGTVHEDASGAFLISWTERLAGSQGLLDFRNTVDAVLTDDHSALARLHQFIATAAQWCEERGLTDVAARYRAAADGLETLGDDLATAEQAARDHQGPCRAGPGTGPAPHQQSAVEDRVEITWLPDGSTSARTRHPLASRMLQQHGFRYDTSTDAYLLPGNYDDAAKRTRNIALRLGTLAVNVSLTSQAPAHQQPLPSAPLPSAAPKGRQR